MALRIPGAALVPGADEHQVAAHGVGAVFAPPYSSGLTTLPRLLDIFSPSVAQDHALVEQPQHRLVEVHDAQVAQRLGEEARVQQVHGGVLDAAGVLVDRQPVVAARLSQGMSSAAAAGRASSKARRRRTGTSDEHMKVSMVSVSRSASPPHCGQVTWRKPSWYFSGLSPVGRNSASSGSSTGRSS